MADKHKTIEELQAEIAALQLQVAEKKRLEPTLRGRTDVAKLFASPKQFYGQAVGVAGWVRTTRIGGGGRIAFIKVYDGTTAEELQVVAPADTPGFEDIKKGSMDASVFVIGTIIPSQGKGQAFEMSAISIRVLGECPDSYPLQGKGHSLEFLREQGHLRFRTATMGAVFRVRSALAFATHEFFNSSGYRYIHTPLITASDCEGGGEMFQVTTLLGEDGEPTHRTPDGKVDQSADFFKKPSFLTVSGQLNAETAAMGLSKVYTFGPTFRAENSNTARHLAEFWMIEPEVAFADLTENMDIAEAYLKYCIAYVLRECSADLALLEAFEQSHRTSAAVSAPQAAPAKSNKQLKKEAEAAKKAARIAKQGDAAPATAPAVAPKEKKEEKKKQEPKKENKADEEPVKEKKAPPSAEEIEARKAAATAAKAAKKAAALAAKAAKQDGDNKKKKAKKAAAPAAAAAAAAVNTTPNHWRDVPLRQRLQNVAMAAFARVTYTEAISILQQAVSDGVTFEESKIEWGMDMGSEHERFLCERHFALPTIVTNYPKEIKAFYMREDPGGKTVSAMDILVPGVGELMGGSQREERMDVLLRMMAEKNLDPEDYSWYLDLRRYGSVPHSGFGLGFERLVMYCTALRNIRDVSLFPRNVGSCRF